MATLETESAGLRARVGELDAEIYQLRTASEGTTLETSRLTQALAESQAEVEAMRSQVEARTSECQEATSSLEELRSLYDRTQQLVASKDDEIDELKSRAYDSESEAPNGKTPITYDREYVDAIHQRLEIELSEARSSTRSLEDKLYTSELTAHKLLKQNGDFKSQIESLLKSLEFERDRTRRKEREIESLRNGIVPNSGPSPRPTHQHRRSHSVANFAPAPPGAAKPPPLPMPPSRENSLPSLRHVSSPISPISAAHRLSPEGVRALSPVSMTSTGAPASSIMSVLPEAQPESAARAVPEAAPYLVTEAASPPSHMAPRTPSPQPNGASLSSAPQQDGALLSPITTVPPPLDSHAVTDANTPPPISPSGTSPRHQLGHRRTLSHMPSLSERIEKFTAAVQASSAQPARNRESFRTPSPSGSVPRLRSVSERASPSFSGGASGGHYGPGGFRHQRSPTTANIMTTAGAPKMLDSHDERAEDAGVVPQEADPSTRHARNVSLSLLRARMEDEFGTHNSQQSYPAPPQRHVSAPSRSALLEEDEDEQEIPASPPIAAPAPEGDMLKPMAAAAAGESDMADVSQTGSIIVRDEDEHQHHHHHHDQHHQHSTEEGGEPARPRTRSAIMDDQVMWCSACLNNSDLFIV